MATPYNSARTSLPTPPQQRQRDTQAHGDLGYVSLELGYFLKRYPSKQDGIIAAKEVEEVEVEEIEKERREKYESQLRSASDQ